MRRKASIIVGAFAALALGAAAGVVAWHFAGTVGRPVGSWHDATGPGAVSTAGRQESARSRQQVGELVTVDKPLGYATGPSTQTFRYTGASYVKLHFGRVTLGADDYLTVAGADGAESYRYDAGSVPPDRWAMSVSGDTARLTLHRAAGSAAGAAVDRVARGYTPAEQATVPASRTVPAGRNGREESVCGGDESVDAVCYKSSDPVAYTRSKAIARLLVNGTELCTGWRLGPDNRMVTANHCLDSTADADATEVWFNYRCAKCGGGPAVKPTKVWGVKVLATDHLYDYTLFTVDHFSSVRRFGYLSLDTARPVRGQELYVPQHPAGAPTKIAGARGDKAGTCAVVDNAYDGYTKSSDVSYYCDTEGGSSGSPVLSRKTDKVVALHHFGGCPNSGVRGDVLYRKLKPLL